MPLDAPGRGPASAGRGVGGQIPPYHAAVHQIDLLKATFGVPLPPDCPLFPTSKGNACLKVDIADALERTLVAAGLEVTSDTGAKLYGGHSFRVTGAQRLASLGVEISKIMVLARWSSDAVLRYVREAPLDRLPAEVAALEEQRDLLKVVGSMQEGLRDLSSRLQSHTADADGREQALKRELASTLGRLQAKFAPSVQNHIIARCGRRRYKVHVAGAGGVELPPSLWRTKCGVKFAM